MTQALTTASTTPPTYEDVMARARALVPALKSRTAKAEALRRVPEETIQDLHAAGLFRILQPRRVGGVVVPSAVDVARAGDGHDRVLGVVADGDEIVLLHSRSLTRQSVAASSMETMLEPIQKVIAGPKS